MPDDSHCTSLLSEEQLVWVLMVVQGGLQMLGRKRAGGTEAKEEGYKVGMRTSCAARVVPRLAA
jgi:hypothetical protein